MKSGSGDSSPLGRFGAIGSPVGAAPGAPGSARGGGPGSVSSEQAADSLAAKMGALSTADRAPTPPSPPEALPAGWAKVRWAAGGCSGEGRV